MQIYKFSPLLTGVRQLKVKTHLNYTPILFSCAPYCNSRSSYLHVGTNFYLLKQPNSIDIRHLSTTAFSYQIKSPPEVDVSTITTEQILTQTEEIAEIGNVQSSSPILSSSPVEEKLILADIPEPPIVPELVEEVSKIVLNSAGEPTFESLGLGGWTPPGLLQTCFEFLHINIGLPWWATILTATIAVRILVFPLVIKSQKNSAKMRNTMPEMQRIQLKITEARQTGDQYMAAKYTNDLLIFMKEKDVNPLKSMLVPLAMAPVFISFFFGLRKMANLPVESMRDGGLLWFTDLTVMDPYYILPLITSVTLWITIEVGADGVKANSIGSGNADLMKYVLRAIPIMVFPMTMSFPSALLCYWVSTNTISLMQVSLLRIPAVRDKFGIEPLKKFSKEDLPENKKGFVDSAKDSWTNLKITRTLEDRERFDEMNFKRAGRGPLPKTFKYDPTKIQAKSK